MQTEDDQELAALLRAAIAGDEAAYARFLAQVAGLVRRLVRRKLGGAATEIEDIVQETLLAIHNKRHTWRQDAPVTPWVRAIARYKVIDSFRRRGRRIEVDIDDFAEILAAEEQETASAREIERALDGLAPGQRQVVRSISVEGHSISETATALGMKETAVRVAFHRGLSAIAARFGRKEP